MRKGIISALLLSHSGWQVRILWKICFLTLHLGDVKIYKLLIELNS